MKKILLIPSLVMILLGTSVTAQTYSCTLKDRRNSGWLPDRLVFELVSGQTTARAYDPITYSTLGQPVDAKVQTENSVRVILKWKTAPYRNDQATLTRDLTEGAALPIEYNATLLRGGNMIMLRANPSGIHEHFSAQGACDLSEGSLDPLIGP